MKFILIENQVKGYFHYYFIAFSKNIIHLDMYISTVELIRKYGDATKIKCVSAGDYLKGKCSGLSTSLGIECHKETERVIIESNYRVYEQSQF